MLGSTRKAGRLDVVDLCEARYVAFVRASDFSKLKTELATVQVTQDFDGWLEIKFKDYDARKQALEKHGELLFEADVSPVRRFLADNEVKIEAPRRCYIDIETDSRVPPRVQAEEAPGRIVSWAIVDEEGNQFTGVLEADDDLSESDLLADMWRTLADYDQVAAWFGDSFDFPVIELRSQRLARTRSKMFAPYWEHRRRLLMVDMAACFARHHKAPESGDDKTSMKLNDVCQALLGEGKHEFSARKTWEYWAAGGAQRDELVAYNRQDTALLPKLEQATGYLALQQTLAEVTWTPASSHGLKPMPQVDGLMLRDAFLRKTHLPSKKPPTGLEEKYEGAYVMKPTSIGIHETVHVCDFKSLYPTVIRSLNIGTETKDLIGCLAFGTDVSFGTAEESALARCCRMLMEQRDHWKKKAKADPNDKYAERMNKAFKIACNAIYGVMGSVWSRFYDVQIAESITLGAQALIRTTKTAAEDRGLEVIYIDTDSLFVKGCTVEEFKAFVNWCNAELYPKMLAKQGANLAFNCIELDYEKCFARLVFPLGNEDRPVAKRYAGSFLHYAFRPKDKPEIKGLEYMRGDSIRLARHMQKEAIDRVLAGQGALELEEWVLGQRHRVMTEKLPVEEIMLSKGLGQELKDYKADTAHVRLAKELEAEGEDIGQGSRIAYVITSGLGGRTEIIAAEKYDGAFDRYHCWNKMVYPATLRVLAGAFPSRNWQRWVARRPKPALPGQLDLLSLAKSQ